MRPIHIAYALLGCFFVVERLLRRGESARSLKEGPSDRGSTRVIGFTFGLALLTLLIAPFLSRRGVGRLPIKKVGWVGIAVMMSGLVVRIWASLVLGSSFTRTLRIDADQQLIAGGPYRFVRHPGYLGDILFWFGAGIATSNWIAVIAISFPVLGIYLYRMQAEEAMLVSAFPQEYRSYASRTWRIIPFIY